jgi:CubicO group peptidase (beta-lactamase class C family)
MITLGRVVEEMAGMPLAEYVRTNFFAPLGMKDTGFDPDRRRCAPTSPEEPGVVHDPLARSYMTKDHQSGNAGLFSTADDLAIFCRALLTGRILRPETVEMMFRPNAHTRGLGWDVFDDPPYKPGVGHTGYTGTLIWMDPAKGWYAIILTNRVYPDDKANVARLRREVLAVVNR